jgi:predicted HicB family RNase H-like nuclease
MTEMLNYKGYTGRVEYDDEARVFHGEVLGLTDVITFQGTDVEELERAFRDSVDDYLDFCRQRGEAPDKPYSGRLMLRLPSGLHREVHLQAQREGKSLNQWISERIAHTLDA